MEERGFDTTVTAGAVFELLRDAIELVPGVAELVIDELLGRAAPGTPDNAPAIGPGALAGLHWATGHYPPRDPAGADHRGASWSPGCSARSRRGARGRVRARRGSPAPRWAA